MTTKPMKTYKNMFVRHEEEEEEDAEEDEEEEEPDGE